MRTPYEIKGAPYFFNTWIYKKNHPYYWARMVCQLKNLMFYLALANLSLTALQLTTLQKAAK
jgi:hypothetical protein